MRHYKALAAMFALLLATPAAAQLSAPIAPPSAPPEAREDPILQGDLIQKTGSDRVVFAGNEYAVSPAARATLTAQARWLIANPAFRVSIEGHGDDRDTRERAIALGERRATAVRNFLVGLGVSPARLTTTSWGKERPVQSQPGFPAAVSARVVLVILR